MIMAVGLTISKIVRGVGVGTGRGRGLDPQQFVVGGAAIFASNFVRPCIAGDAAEAVYCMYALEFWLDPSACGKEGVPPRTSPPRRLPRLSTDPRALAPPTFKLLPTPMARGQRSDKSGDSEIHCNSLKCV